jgi:hypothetical protein
MASGQAHELLLAQSVGDKAHQPTGRPAARGRQVTGVAGGCSDWPAGAFVLAAGRYQIIAVRAGPTEEKWPVGRNLVKARADRHAYQRGSGLCAPLGAARPRRMQ